MDMLLQKTDVRGSAEALRRLLVGQSCLLGAEQHDSVWFSACVARGFVVLARVALCFLSMWRCGFLPGFGEWGPCFDDCGLR